MSKPSLQIVKERIVSLRVISHDYSHCNRLPNSRHRWRFAKTYLGIGQLITVARGLRAGNDLLGVEEFNK